MAETTAHAEALDAVVRLATDITRQLAYLGEDEATSAFITHVTSFWDPRMRKQLVTAVKGGHARVDDVMRAAVASGRL